MPTALLSVYDKSGIVDLAEGLHAAGWRVLSSGGTAKAVAERGVPVTDEALTQCIRTLRRQLGDDASRPRFIETVPKHGYRFVALVDSSSAPASATRPVRFSVREVVLLGGAGTVGGGLAGFVGGLFYGFAGASQPLAPGMGAISIVLVLSILSASISLCSTMTYWPFATW